MATIAKLYLNSSAVFTNGINLIECSFRLNQSIDSAFKPIGRPVGGQIFIVLDAMFDSESDLFNWMVVENDFRSGEIEFFKQGVDTGNFVIPMQQKRVLSFKDAACINYLETYSILGESRIAITLVAKNIVLNGIEYKNPWPENT